MKKCCCFIYLYIYLQTDEAQVDDKRKSNEASYICSPGAAVVLLQPVGVDEPLAPAHRHTAQSAALYLSAHCQEYMHR